MLVIKFSIHNSRLRRITSGTIPSNAYSKVKFEFDFRTDDWNPLGTKTANFYCNGENYFVELDEYNQCFVPKEVFNSQSFKISIFDTNIITNTLKIPVEGISVSIVPSFYEQILKMIEEHKHEEYIEENEVDVVVEESISRVLDADAFDAGKIINGS